MALTKNSSARTSILERVLALRPTSSVSRLGNKSRVLLLNPRDLLRALESSPMSLLCVQLPSIEALPGILRAARDQDAVLGLSCAHPFPKRNYPVNFFETVKAAAEEIDHKRPLFLQGGPVRIVSLEQKSLEMAAAEVFKFVDAGFPLISLDTSSLPIDDYARIAAGLSRMAIERELAIEVAAPLDAGSRPSPEKLRLHLDALAKKGLEPKFIRLKSTTVMPLDAGEAEGDFEALEALQAVAKERNATLSIEDRGTPSRLLSSWTAAGVRKMDVGQPFARVALRALSSERQEELRTKAREAGVGVAELMGRTDAPLSAVEVSAKERVEALCYGEAIALFESFGAVGSGQRSMRKLAEKSGE